MVQLKSDRELEKMRVAGRHVGEILVALREMAKPGVTTGEINDAAMRKIRERELGSSFLGYGPRGAPPYPAVICISVNEEIVHGIPGRRELKEGDVVKFDFGVIFPSRVVQRLATNYAIERSPLDPHQALVHGVQVCPNRLAGVEFDRKYVGRPVGARYVDNFAIMPVEHFRESGRGAQGLAHHFFDFFGYWAVLEIRFKMCYYIQSRIPNFVCHHCLHTIVIDGGLLDDVRTCLVGV